MHTAVLLFFACLLYLGIFTTDAAFVQSDEGIFLSAFQTLTNAAYSAPLPTTSDFLNACPLAAGQTRKLDYSTIPRVNLTSSMKTSQAKSLCSPTDMCVVPTGVTLTVDSNFVVGMLFINGGSLIWNSQSQTTDLQWLCAGSIVAANKGVINIDLSNQQVLKKAIIYIQNNGVSDPSIGFRVFGGYENATITVQGRPMVRTWSLLATPTTVGSSEITLMHDPVAMGWAIGDRIQIAPTVVRSGGTAENFYIKGFGASGSNIVKLSSDSTMNTTASIGQIFDADYQYISSDYTAQMAAEVINLNRNVLITGDDFENVQCSDPQVSSVCKCDNGIPRSTCTMGLHTILSGTGTLQMKYVRIEKCGQRGILGRYCTHFHYSGICPQCVLEGNAVENSMQRGTSVHGTMASTLLFNVYSGVRGSMVYIEDGNEMYNQILYNVAVCPWVLDGPLYGCTIPGTDNGQADTSLNQAGFWGSSFTNYLIGNRAANNFNGMLWDAQGFERGQGAVAGQLCGNNQLIGRMEGNTFHGSGRFGTYFLVSVFPKTTDRNIDQNGVIKNFSTCNAFDSLGNDRGAPQTVYRHVDYGNSFVGQYGLGDVNYVEHVSISSLNLIYWKETKNFADGCSSHLLNTVYSDGNLALPGGHGAFIIENVTFMGDVHFENNHHCGVGTTGILCMPTYVFANSRWQSPPTTKTWSQWGANNGAMFTLSPPECGNSGIPINGSIFPTGYCSVANPFWTYLLALDGGNTCFNTTALGQTIGNPNLGVNWGGGIMCKRGLRRLEIYSFNQTLAQNPPPMVIELYQQGNKISSQSVEYWQIGDDPSKTRKQGYAFTLVTGLEQSYKLAFANGSGIPTSWIIEFSDPVFGNRWTADKIDITIAGRNCPSPLTSQHDRKFIWGDSNDNFLNVPGRGACSGFPDEAPVTCSGISQNYVQEVCSKCAGLNCGANGYCDCGLRKCICKSGFSGTNCQNDICANAGCDYSKGACNLKYLGGTLTATKKQCVCKPGFFGDLCRSDPCYQRTCSGNGICVPLNATDSLCNCTGNFTGSTCNITCGGTSNVTCAPPCIYGTQYYYNNDYSGGNIAVSGNIDSKEGCASMCAQNVNCSGFAYSGNTCYFKKSGGKLQSQNGVWAGIKCTDESVMSGPENIIGIVTPTPSPIPSTSISTTSDVSSTTSNNNPPSSDSHANLFCILWLCFLVFVLIL